MQLKLPATSPPVLKRYHALHFSPGHLRSVFFLKWMTVYLLMFCLHSFAGVFSQTVTISAKGISVEKALEEIRRQGHVEIWYDKSIMAQYGDIDINIKNASIADALKEVCRTNDLTFSINDKIIAVFKKPVIAVHSQTEMFPIKGKVVDEKDAPVVGATIAVKGTHIVVATDANGQFELPPAADGHMLRISSVGYQSKEIKAIAVDMTIRLVFEVNKLDDVHVIAYGTTTQRYSTGSVSKISSEDISKQPVTNPISAIQGLAPGAFVQTQNGLPGGNIKVTIRGQGSIAAGTDPLYVVDGVPFTSTPLNTGTIQDALITANGLVSPLNSIAPSDIESIEILKDADATSIYGSRGANGVVLITTKRGKAGKGKVEANVYKGVSTVSRLPKLLGLKDYLQIRREAFRNDSITPSADPNDIGYAPDLLVWDTTKSSDWSKYLTGGSDPVTNAHISFSGGSERTRYLFGLNYRDEGSILPGPESYRRSGGYISIENTSENKKFYFQASASYTADNNNLLKSTSFTALYLPPDYPIFNTDGSYNWTMNNPVAFLKQRSKTQTENFIASSVFQYTISSGLAIRANLGYTRIKMDMLTTDPASSENPVLSLPSSANFGNSANTTLLAEPQLTYLKDVRFQQFRVLVGSTIQETTTKSYSLEASNYFNESLLENLGAAGTIGLKTNNYTQYKYASVFGRIGWTGWKRYLLNISFRRDGSSRFGPDKTYGNFGAVGAGWIFSEEKALKNNHLFSFLSYGKIRASYGLTGNDQIGDYQYFSSYTTNNVYQGFTTIAPTTIANGKFGWETTRKLEGALELGFFHDKVLATVGYFVNRSGNQLVNFALPYQSGPFGSYEANLPATIENKGTEISVNINSVRLGDFSWTATANLTIPINRLVGYPGLIGSSYANTLVLGQDLSVVKRYRYTGVDPQTGIAKFDDINHDGKLSYPNDFVVAGKTSPESYGGVQNNLSFKNFQLSIFFQFVKQQALINTINLFSPGQLGNQYSYSLGRWQKAGDITDVQKASTTYGTPAYTAGQLLSSSSASVIDGSYVRCKNISLSYTMPKSVMNKAGIDNCRIFIECENLFTLSPHVTKGIDPETISGFNSNVPVLKCLTAGLQINL